MFHPLGFPTLLKTNSAEILSYARGLWSRFDQLFHTRPIRVDVHVLEGGSAECPPAPVFRIAHPLLFNIADAGNYSVSNLDCQTTHLILSRAALGHRTYVEYFFLSAAPLNHIATAFTAPVHAGCVAQNGRGVLLCGDSGAGKSTLSFACARAGFTYVTDDASYLLIGGDGRTVTGNCHQVRFRPSAASLFSELRGLEITPRAAGKPSIEMPTAVMPGITCAPTAHVDFLIFLNRSAAGPQHLVPYCKDAARQSLLQTLFGSPKSLAPRYAALERLLTARVLELRYSSLDWAVRRLESLLVEER
jgi:hypothetical protein